MQFGRVDSDARLAVRFMFFNIRELRGLRKAGMMSVDADDGRVVGADRVLAVLVQLAEYPTGVTLDELAHRLGSSKSTVHRALASLRRARLAMQLGRGVYALGDEFFRLAYLNQATRPEAVLIEPALRELAARYGETAHYAVLDGSEVVYRAKVDPPRGAMRLTSVIGGRNPAHRTGVGKLLLSYALSSLEELREWLGDQVLEARTPHSITSVESLWQELLRTRERGYAVDDQENELEVNCIAVPVLLDADIEPTGAVSVSALAFRTPLEKLLSEVGAIREIVARSRGLHDYPSDQGSAVTA
jgi:IclR family transcriptional regulator, acetate operon repressor